MSRKKDIEGRIDGPEEYIEDEQATADEDRAEYAERISDLEAQRDEFRDLLQRKQAEFANYRKRTLRERDMVRQESQAEVLRNLLPVVDAAEKAFQGLPSGDDPLLEGYREGYRLLLKQLEGVFELFGVEAVPGEGELFDPTLHEAVMREESERHREGEIIEEFRRGYLQGDRLLRAAQVKVAVRPDGEGDPEESAQGRVQVDIKA